MKTLPFVMRKQLLCGQLIRLLRLFNCVKAAKMSVLALVLYLSQVFFYAWPVANTPNPELVVCLYAFVFAVLFYGHISQVFNFVVQFVTINVVNRLLWKAPKLKKPNQPVDSVFSSVKLHIPIASRSDASSNRPHLGFWLAFFSQQKAVLFVVFKEVNNTLFDVFCLVHERHYR